MAELNTTPNSNRLHIGIFGRTNSGKSSFINQLAGHKVSIVSETSGTTTDPVCKAMEISPLGACLLMDTAGLEDSSPLGRLRMEKTALVMKKTELAIILLPQGKEDILDFEAEKNLLQYFTDKKIPALLAINLFAEKKETSSIPKEWASLLKSEACAHLLVNCKTGEGFDKVREALAKLMPEDFAAESITGSLAKENDCVLLVMPQDIQAPKNRLILPQVQTIRELLDKQCTVICTTADKLEYSLSLLKQPPSLIITDSQVFSAVYQKKPKDSLLTSFSVLFAAYKGDLAYYTQSANAIAALTPQSKVLIAECCTHAPLTEDIGRVKIPRLLRKCYGEELAIDIVSGTDFPENLAEYNLIIQCGGCMFNRRYVLSRIQQAKKQQIPMTNYGIAIAYLLGILDKLAMPSLPL